MENQKLKLRVLQLVISNCLGCSQVRVNFPRENNAHFVLYNVPGSVKADTVTPVVHALQLLCTMTYAEQGSLQRLPLLEIGRGYVGMSFQLVRTINVAPDESDDDEELDMGPSTSQQARQREQARQQRRQQRREQQQTAHLYQVHCLGHVVRRFDNADWVYHVNISINNEPIQQVSFAEFHGRFFVPALHVPNVLRNLYEGCAGNWLSLIQADEDSYKSLKGDGNPFEIFAKLLECQESTPQSFLGTLTMQYLQANETTRLIERQFLLQLFGKVRHMFEFISVQQYTVWFFVPRLNRYATLEQVHVEDFDLSNVRTSIRLISDDSDYFWENTDHNIKDILLIAFQLALADMFNQSVLFLGKLGKLCEFICMKYVTAAFMNRYYMDDPDKPQWICEKYLQRIVELCDLLDLLVFIEYPGSLTLLTIGRHVVKCKLTDKGLWTVYEDVTKKDEGFEDLVDILKFN